MCSRQKKVEGDSCAHRGAPRPCRLLCALAGLVTLVVLWGVSPASAQKPELTLAGQFSHVSPGLDLVVRGCWGGAVYSVAVDPADPDIAYVGSGRRLVILDVADPVNVVELGSIDVENVVLEVKVRGGYAYVGTYADPYTFCIIDVSDPMSPEIVWHKTGHTYGHYRLEFYGDYVYIGETEDLEVRDISDPENPGGEHRVLPFAVYSHAIAGDLLYVGCDDDPGELRIYDLSVDPFNPPLVGGTPLPNPEFRMRPRSIAVEGNYVYMGSRAGSPDYGQTGGVAVVDVSDPQAPFVTGYYNDFWRCFFPGYPWHSSGIAASGGYVYVADWTDGANCWEYTQGLVILDVATDPANPRLASAFRTHGTVMGVEVVGTRAYVMDEGEGLIILDVSDPENPVRFGRPSSGWHSPQEMRKVDKVGNLLYVTDEWNGITILDVCDVRSPELVGVYQTEQTGLHMDHWGIEVRDGVAYLAAGYGHLEAVDVRDPGNPVLIGTGEFLPGYHAIGLELSGDIAHVGYGPPSGSDFRFVNFDVSDLQNIDVVGDVWVGSYIRSIDVRMPDGIAFTARTSSGGGTMTTVDTSDPTNPTVIFNGSPGGVDLVRDGNLLYLANENSDPNLGGLYIYEAPAHDPNEPNYPDPSYVGHFPTRFASGVDIQDGVAYLMTMTVDEGDRRLLALDVRDPQAPRLLGQFKTSQSCGDMEQRVYVDGRHAYVTAPESGLTIIEIVRSCRRLAGHP